MNKLKKLLAAQIPFAGYTLALGSSRVTDILARSGIDFLMIDLQHGYFNKCSAADSIRSMLSTQTTPLARVANNCAGEINDLLDAGAMGVVVPMVESADDARRAVCAAFYPPLGGRSKGSVAPVIYGEDYSHWANDEILLVIMLETENAIAQVDEIFSVKGISACLIGTSDLSFNMGCRRDSQQVIEAVAKVILSGERHGVSVGVAIGTPDEVKNYAPFKPAFYLITHDLGLLKEASQQLSGQLMTAMQRSPDTY